MPAGTNKEDTPCMDTSVSDLWWKGRLKDSFHIAWFFSLCARWVQFHWEFPDMTGSQQLCWAWQVSFQGVQVIISSRLAAVIGPIKLRFQLPPGTTSLSTLSNHRTTQAYVTKAGKELESPLKQKHISAAFWIKHLFIMTDPIFAIWTRKGGISGFRIKSGEGTSSFSLVTYFYWPAKEYWILCSLIQILLDFTHSF